MKRFSLRGLFFFIAVAAFLIAGTLWLIDARKNLEFRKSIQLQWQKSPIASSETKVGEANDIVFQIVNGNLLLESGGILKPNNNWLGPHFPPLERSFKLDCDEGEFLVRYYGPNFKTHLLSESDSKRSAYDWLAECSALEFTPETHYRSQRLWSIRKDFFEGLKDKNFLRFDEPSKKGFLIWSNNESDYLIIVFDQFGSNAMSITPLVAKQKTPHSLADRIVLEFVSGPPERKVSIQD